MGHDAGERWRQNFRTLRLPDFCNLGTWLRILLAVNGMALLIALSGGRQPAAVLSAFVELAAYVEPVTFGSLLVLCGGRRWLAPLAPLQQALTALLAWFDLAARAHAPAVAEARLMALTARIRPHFLFNSLNAVLGVIRSDPRRAETALEELAELFRSLMQDNRELVPLSAEIALSRQYLDLERLRLGERLQVRWDVDACPPDALVPPLMLQPLLENAVYHGIEPLGEPGEIQVHLACRDDRISVEITNPSGPAEAGNHHAGNRMALANIRERLALFFDLEANMTMATVGGRFLVRIELPYRRGGSE
jgi:two-component system sensor histidine kinase AlgZ